MKKRVIIIDGDLQFVSVIRYLISAIEKLHIVNTYEECGTALKNFERDQPDMIIMDSDSRTVRAADFISKVRRSKPETEILVLADYFDEDLILNLVSSGATGFLLKQNGLTNFENHIRQLMRGGSPLDPDVARVILRAHSTNDESPLTVKETVVLKLIMNGMTYSMIADEMGISKETSKTHIRNIYRKLNVSCKAEAVSKAISSKLVPVSLLARGGAAM